MDCKLVSPTVDSASRSILCNFETFNDQLGIVSSLSNQSHWIVISRFEIRIEMREV